MRIKTSEQESKTCKALKESIQILTALYYSDHIKFKTLFTANNSAKKKLGREQN